MTTAAIDPDAFDAFEAAGWEARAAGYDGFFAPLTGRLADPLLDAASVGPGSRVLDVGTGPGYVAGRAVERGSTVVGVDVAEAMVTLARRLRPGLDVRRGDAHALPFADASFDAVVSNFAILHFGRPERAAAEFARVVRPGGAVALTTWDAPDRARVLGAMLGAVADVGAAPPAGIPAGPDFFRFSDEGEFRRLLAGAGLEDVRVQTIPFTHRIDHADVLWDGLVGGTVRTGALVRGQPEDVRARIREALHRRLEAFRGPDGIDLPASVKLASGRRPRA